MTTIHKGNSARSTSLEVLYIAQHWEICLMCVFLFKKSVAERKQKAESVIKKKEKWFLNVIQVTPHDPRSRRAHVPPTKAALAFSVCYAHNVAFLSGPLPRCGWSNPNQAQFLDISLSAVSTSISAA